MFHIVLPVFGILPFSLCIFLCFSHVWLLRRPVEAKPVQTQSISDGDLGRARCLLWFGVQLWRQPQSTRVENIFLSFSFLSLLCYRRFVSLMAKGKSVQSSQQGSMDRRSNPPKRWNLSDIPKPLIKITLAHLFAHRALLCKKLAIRKLRWREANSFEPTRTGFREGRETISIVLGEYHQQQLFTIEMEKKIQLVSKEIEAVKAKAQETLVALVKGFDNFFDGVTNFIREFDSVEADQFMDAGDDMGAVDMVPTLMFESNNNSKAKALINVAEAKGLSSVIVDNDYDAWERFQNMKMVSKTARVNEREKKERIQKEFSDAVDNQENEERSIYNQVTLLTEAVHNLLNTRSEKVNQNTKDSKNSKNSKNFHKSHGSTSSANAAKTAPKKKRRTLIKKRPRIRRGKKKWEPKEPVEKGKRKRRGKSGDTPNAKRKGRVNGAP